MKGLEFPMVKTKTKDTVGKTYDLSSPEGRKKYFHEKAGKEIADLKDYMQNNTFIAYMLGKKQAGKSTYVGLLREIFGEGHITMVSVGDLIKMLPTLSEDEERELMEYVKKNYRGFMPIEEAYDALLNSTNDKLVPADEFILTLIKWKIEQVGRTNIFLDGFPRNVDQVSYSLYLRDLINFRDDPDLFVMIDIPEEVIAKRILGRRVCPKCRTSLHMSLNPSSITKYEDGEFVLYCDNPECEEIKLEAKRGDHLGIENIRGRLNIDDELIRLAFKLQGVPKVFLRNSVPVEIAGEMVDDYEITQEVSYSQDNNGEVVRHYKDWVIKDDNDIDSISLLAAPVALAMIKQLHEILVN